MPNQATIQQLQQGAYLGSRPFRVNRRTGEAQIRTERNLVVNSLLRGDEWRALDNAIQMAAVTRLRTINDLRARGLVETIGSFGTLTTQWSRASEMTAADISMNGRGAGERSRVEFSIAGQPVPIVWKEFEIGTRQLESARLSGDQLDTSHAMAATRVVAEKLEDMLVNGDASVVFDGNTLVGYTTQANRNTGTATGDWGTIANVITTVSNMIGAAEGDRYYGPYVLYASTTQYREAATTFFSDGSGQNAIQRLLQIDSLDAVYPSDTLADGVVVLVQTTADVVTWAEHMAIQVVEWASGDGMTNFFKVMAVATPKVKSDYNSRSGIVHYTGA